MINWLPIVFTLLLTMYHTTVGFFRGATRVKVFSTVGMCTSKDIGSGGMLTGAMEASRSDHSIYTAENQYGRHANDSAYMKLALRHAQFAFREKEVPIGAVIVDAEGNVIATGRNRVESTHDASNHAEIYALKRAAKVRGNWRLSDCTLFSTLEPCAMCLGAIQSFRLRRVVYGAKDIRLGACGSWVDLCGNTTHPFHQVKVEGGLLADESSILLKRFFQMRRRESTLHDDLGKRKDTEEQIDRGFGFEQDKTFA
jgi:tRNA(adenine34) deaminase